MSAGFSLRLAPHWFLLFFIPPISFSSFSIQFTFCQSGGENGLIGKIRLSVFLFCFRFGCFKLNGLREEKKVDADCWG